MGEARKARGLRNAPGGRTVGGMAAGPVVSRFLRDERGATAIEYGLICALIFLAIISGVSIFGTKTTATYKVISDAVEAVL